MGNVAIQVKGLRKKYHIGVLQKKHDRLGEQLVEAFTAPFRRVGKLLRGQASGAAELDETIWALQDVSFEVNHGEVVGIIGRNGAGKSTLLKILSQITDPTEGHADLFGRVGSLLEVGTGFHPELTGRENVYLNGAILGMSRTEIDRKFDEIVAFAEIEKFIDTPVKHYSSGMYVRLAFAVAAHLEPEILLVDEVLAVGDVAFQKKCLGKMDEVSQAGRTILFISHNMTTVQQLCTRSILIENGQIACDGPTDTAVKRYLNQLNENVENAFGDNPERKGNGKMRLTGARVLNGQNQPSEYLVAGEPATFEFSYENPGSVTQAMVGCTIHNHLGVSVAHFRTSLTDSALVELTNHGKFMCHIPNLPLPLGQYRVEVSLRQQKREYLDHIPTVLNFNVESSTFYPNGQVPEMKIGACLISHEWIHKITKQSLQTA